LTICIIKFVVIQADIICPALRLYCIGHGEVSLSLCS
jgi:hypothetical protein